MVWHLQCETVVARSEMKKFAYHRADYKAMNEWLISKIDWNDKLEGRKVSMDVVCETLVEIIN